MWSRVTLPSDDGNGYTPNHFVALDENPRASISNSTPMEISPEADQEVKTSRFTDEVFLLSSESDLVVEQYEKEENLQAETTEAYVDDMSAPTTELSTGALILEY